MIGSAPYSYSSDNSKHSMTMRYPATRWQDALPTGNGIVGALMYGKIQNEIVVLNHGALYFPKGKAPLVDVSDLLPELRRLIGAGQYREAEALMPRAYAERAGLDSGSTSTLRDPYQPFCDIRLQSSANGAFRNYRRGVDFASGRVWTQWSDDAGTTTREVFVSRECDTVFLRVRGSRPGAVSCRVWLGKHESAQANSKGWHGTEKTELSVLRQAAEGENLVFAADYPNGDAFGAVARVTTDGGRVRADKDGLAIEGCNEFVVQVKLFLKEAPDLAIARMTQELAAQPGDFDAALTRHSALHGELFGRMTLALDQEALQSNEELLMAAYDGDVPSCLVQRMLEFGRYLLISSSRPGGWPANLQGIWNGDFSPAWNADIHTDENIQMNYWQALPGALPETVLPVFDYFERWMDDYRGNAKSIFGCRGVLVPIAQTTHGREYPCVWSHWTAAAGWIGQLFYDYYLFTGDREFLRNRAVPWLQEVALFYEDFLVQGEDGRLLFSPSLSPENVPAGEGMGLLTMNATMDVAVCREVLQNLCSACDLLGIEPEGVQRWKAVLGNLPEYAINGDGAMREWLHPTFQDNYSHRHLSHIYPLFPGLEITQETHPELHEACRIAVEKRFTIGLTSQSGWSMAHLANAYARLGMGNRALECLEILTRSGTGPNLFTYHNDWRDMGLSLKWGDNPPFQIDANLGFAAAVLEMLVFAKPGLIRLLPARPEKWQSGRAAGIACRGGVTVDLEWDIAKGHFHALLSSRHDQDVLLRLPPGFGGFRFSSAGAAVRREDGQTNYWNATLGPGAPLSIQTDAH